MSWKAAIRISAHAKLRQQQRKFDDAAIEAALVWGQVGNANGDARAFFIGRQSIRRARRAGEDICRYAGATVIASTEGTIITVMWRERDGRTLLAA